VAGALVVTLIGCSTAEKPVAEGPTGVPEELAADGTSESTAKRAEVCEAKLGATSPVHAVGNLYLAGQPSKDDMATLAERGIKTIVSLRRPSELDWDEAAAAEAAGMKYVAIPFDSAAELTDDVFAKVRATLKDHADEPTVLHCGRANRVGAVWMAHRVLDDGVGIDAALAEAKAVGLKTPEYVEKAQEYIERMQAGEGANESRASGGGEK
jgi:uncharacterized protein (TIGR01244 family)